MAYDASCNHSGFLVLTLTYLRSRTDLVKSVCEALAGPYCWFFFMVLEVVVLEVLTQGEGLVFVTQLTHSDKDD